MQHLLRERAVTRRGQTGVAEGVGARAAGVAEGVGALAAGVAAVTWTPVRVAAVMMRGPAGVGVAAAGDAAGEAGVGAAAAGGAAGLRGRQGQMVPLKAIGAYATVTETSCWLTMLDKQGSRAKENVLVQLS